ncbi:MAG: CDP-alcohol phosphatidyltransferase family protein [Firmicutes bacterium]|nr:CDP-alcohol phosphatidyltransferase family protein [Bacillota bacterium]MBQ3112187.1 CDP-alcohol phosphatidyltransferase family protein [Bacillota bacterium]MBR6823528.1 CDP-alcohol phosphatidyltransferase family protein [Bacillota bacterium]
MIGYYNYTVIATYFGGMAAIYGIYLCAQGDAFGAVLCLLFAGCMDMIDGKIASTMKRTSGEKAFGIQIDSLCDLISFGVLPAMIGYAIGLRSTFAIAVMIAFVMAALIRLAYFNVDEFERQQKTTERRKYYEGMPVTTTAVLIPIIYVLRAAMGSFFPIFYCIALMLIACAFLLRFRLPKPGTGGLIVCGFVGIMLLIALFTLK